MAIRLKDIPFDPLTPEDVEALANEEFDYADRERVSLREARRKIREEFQARQDREALTETNKIFGTTLEIPILYNTGTISEGYGDFTFKEKAFEIAKVGHSGLGQIIKLPGIALKAIGEVAPTRAEREKLRQSPSTFKQTQARSLDAPLGKSVLKGYDLLRRAGNKYIETVNGLTFDESPESRAARQQSFLSAPFYRTAFAVSGSAPSYGLAIAATLTSGNPNLGLYVLGATTSSASYESLREQGVDPDLAIVGAALEGSIEMFTEKIPMDMLMKGGGRPFLIRALRLGTAEAFQELFAQLGQNYVSEVVKDVDPDDLSTIADAAVQQWDVITQGWQDAMAAGFVMGGVASTFSPPPDFGRTSEEMIADYGFVPRNVNEILSLADMVKQRVKDVEKVATEPVEAEKPVEGKVGEDKVTEGLEAKQEVFHGTDAKITGPIKPSKSGFVFVATTEDFAKGFGKNITKFEIPADKILQLKNPDGSFTEAGKEITDKLGFDNAGEFTKDALPEAEKRGFLAIQRGNEIVTRPEVLEAKQEGVGKVEVITPPSEATVEKIKTEMVRVPEEDVTLFDNLRQDTIDFNKTRVSKEKKAELIADTKEIKTELGRKGYSPEFIKAVQMGDVGIPFPPQAQPTPTEHAGVGEVKPLHKKVEAVFKDAPQKLKDLIDVKAVRTGADLNGAGGIYKNGVIFVEAGESVEETIAHETGHNIIEKFGKDEKPFIAEYIKLAFADRPTVVTDKFLKNLKESADDRFVRQIGGFINSVEERLADDIATYVLSPDKLSKEMKTLFDGQFEAQPTPTEPVSQKVSEKGQILPEELPIPEKKVSEIVSEKPVPQTLEEIGEGEEKARGTSVSVLAQAIEDAIVEENKVIFDEIPTYRAMNMREQAEKAAKLIEDDIEMAKRVAFYEEVAPLGLFPENVFTGLRVHARDSLDVDLIMDLALNEDVVREHTIMGKRIKSLDTDQDFADPVRAIREVVEARKEDMLRKGKDVSALELKLRELQTQLDESKKALGEFSKRAGRQYGTRNKLVTRSDYDNIMKRWTQNQARLRSVFVPTPQDLADVAKISIFHLEALGRDFAKYSHEMVRDFGEWVRPLLQEEFDKAIKQAETDGVEIKESKRLITKKKRLVTVTGKLEAKFEEQDLAKIPRIPIELDAEGAKLQAEYDLAREKYKAAQSVANIITEKEVRIIAELAKDAAGRRSVMERSTRRNNLVGEAATQTELEYGIAMSMFLEYVGDLKVEANKRTFGEVLKGYLTNPVDFISDFAGTLKAAKASLDNSFLLRQGLPTFMKGITGHKPSAKIWWKTFTRSWRTMWDTLKKKKVMRGLFAEIISDPDYELLKTAKVALNVIEEEIPVDIPSRIPLLGILFRMGENAFVSSSRYMRYQLAKQYINVWRKSGKELNKRELESIGRLANSQTGRGDSAAKGQRPGLLNNLFWSPRNLRAYVDILSLHLFDRNFSGFARYQAARNLLHYISGAAMILAMAKWIDDDSVTFDSNSADFGKIRIGDTRFSVGGGIAVLVVLASRLITREFTSSTTGVTKSIDSRRFGAIGGKDLLFNFVNNKLSPAAALALSIIDQKTWDGNKLVIPQMVNDALTPLIIQNVFETGSSDDSANVLAALIAEALGVNVQTYNARGKFKSKRRTKP